MADIILGGSAYYKSDGTSKLVVAADDIGNNRSDLYVDSSGTWVIQNQLLTKTNNIEFENFVDMLFAVNLADATRSYNGTAWSTSTNVTDAPKAKYIKEFNTQLYLANLDIGGNKYPYRLCFSSYPSSALAITWDTTNNYIDVPSFAAITGLGKHNQRLMVFTEDELYRWDGNSFFAVPSCPGTRSHRSIITHLGYMFYTDGQGRGIWKYDGSTSTLISAKIQPFIDGINADNLSTVCSYANKDYVRFFVGDIVNSTEDISITNAYIEYNIASQSWFVGSRNTDVTCYFDYKDVSALYAYDAAELAYDNDVSNYDGFIPLGRSVFAGDSNTKVYKIDSGYTDDGTNLPFIIETPDYFQGDAARFKDYHRIAIRTKFGSNLTAQYKVDDERWVELGECQEEHTVFDFNARGRKIKFRFYDMGSGYPVRFEGLTLYWTPSTLT